MGRFLGVRLKLFATLFLVVSGTAFLGRVGFPFEIVSNLRPQLLTSGLILLGLALVLPIENLWRLALGLMVGLHAWTIAQVPYVSPKEPAPPQPALAIVWANLHRGRDALETLAARTRDADLILLTEVPKLTPDSIQELLPDAVWVASTRDGPSTANWATLDVAALIRPSLRGLRVEGHDLVYQSLNNILKLDLSTADGDRLTVFATHPAPGASPRLLELRNRTMDRLRGLVRTDDHPSIVVGDFNVAPWSPDYARLPGLRAGDPRWSTTWFSTWPGVGLPIDHIHITPKVSLHEAEVLESVGSDHRPLLVKISL